MPPRPHGWRVSQPDDEGVRERSARNRGPFHDRRPPEERAFFWLLYVLAVLAGVCIFVRVL